MSYAQWSPFTTYQVGDIVEYSGSIFQATAINTNKTPLPTKPEWLDISPGGGGVVSLTAGSNVNLTGTVTDPIVNLDSTLLNMAAVQSVTNVDLELVGDGTGRVAFYSGGALRFAAGPSGLDGQQSILSNVNQLELKDIAADTPQVIFQNALGVQKASLEYTAVNDKVTLTANDVVLDAGGPGSNIVSCSAITNDVRIIGNNGIQLLGPLTANLNMGAQFITTTTVNGDITLAPNGAGGVVIDVNNAGSSLTPTLEMINSTSGAGGVVVDFYHNSATPATNDVLGTMSFYGKNSAGTKKEFVRIEALEGNPNNGSEAGYLTISKLNNGSFGTAMSFVGTNVNFGNQNLASIGTITANQIVCADMKATTAAYPKYDANTFVIKNDGSVSTIPAPQYEGETYTGANGGRTSSSWVNVLTGDITHTSYCVADFQGHLFWGGANYLVQTDYNGSFIQEWVVSGGTGEVFTLYVGDSGQNLYIGGSFTDIGGTSCNYIGYMNSTLTINSIIDTSFDNGLNDAVYSIRPEPNSGGIVVGGAFTATGGGGSGPTQLWRVADINVFGANTWNTWAQINDGIVFDTCRFSDGGSDILLVGGSFSSFDASTPTTCAYIVGYNISSASYFAVGSTGGYSDFNGAVRCFTLQSASSNVYVAGDFTDIAGTAYLYSMYFTWTSGFQTPNNYDWTGGTGIYCIEYNPTDGNIYRGGSGVFSFNSIDLQGNPPFTIGLNIRSINGILPYTSGLVYIPSSAGSAPYAYTFQPTSTVSWSSLTDIENASGTPYTAVSASGKGLTFTLKGSLTGGSTGPRWFITANNGCSFS